MSTKHVSAQELILFCEECGWAKKLERDKGQFDTKKGATKQLAGLIGVNISKYKDLYCDDQCHEDIRITFPPHGQERWDSRRDPQEIMHSPSLRYSKDRNRF